ncbi:MAG TPA: ATP-binding protein, partial [Gemmatimonadaceae bacterium]
MLAGRTSECRRLDRILVDVRSGRSAVLVLRGAAGLGKTALLRYAVQQAVGYRILSTVGVESDMELPYAGLHLLCVSVLDRVGRLPLPQRDALETAFGRRTGPRPDRFLVGLATLSLLSDVAEESPLLCVIDDAQWLDQSSIQVLTFVARRMEVESIAFLFAESETERLKALEGFPELLLTGLPDPEARELLHSAISGPLDESVSERIIA